MRENHRSAAFCTPPTGDVPVAKVHALDRNQTRDLSVCRPTLFPLNQTGFGCTRVFFETFSVGTFEGSLNESRGVPFQVSRLRTRNLLAVPWTWGQNGMPGKGMLGGCTALWLRTTQGHLCERESDSGTR
uniref:Uncharacterized protein n=1 Tax=Pipistrellus kuhlii TaxID=59472 RepID=A0A7J7YXF5_PIPKU|nr:hypothetical protein mPipKuh1_009930 [Pipistrellus kuhlii]